MTITLELPDSVEETIEQNAAHQGMDVSAYVLNLIEKEAVTAREDKRRQALELLDSWDDLTEQEMEENRRAWEFLRNALDEDRLSPDRPLFPKGCGL